MVLKNWCWRTHHMAKSQPKNERKQTKKKRQRFKIKATMKIDTILFGFVSHAKRIALNNPLHRMDARTRRKSIKTSKKMRLMKHFLFKRIWKEFMAKANKFDSNAVCIAAILKHWRYNGGMYLVLFCLMLVSICLAMCWFVIFSIWQAAQSQKAMIFKEKDYCIVIETRFGSKCTKMTHKIKERKKNRIASKQRRG